MNVKHCTREKRYTMGSGVRVVNISINGYGDIYVLGAFFKGEGEEGVAQLRVAESMRHACGFLLFFLE